MTTEELECLKFVDKLAEDFADEAEVFQRVAVPYDLSTSQIFECLHVLVKISLLTRRQICALRAFGHSAKNTRMKELLTSR